MAQSFTLFELSWEVCNKVGGIHTVLSTRAKTLVDRLGDDYVAVGPWLLSDTDRHVPLDDEPGFTSFTDACRDQGLPVRVGRWRIPGRPRTILVEFSSLYDKKDDILARLWEDFGVDSLQGAWDYVEPVLFAHAAARVIETWWDERLAPKHRRAVVHANEWMTGAACLYFKLHHPSIGTVFTTHATMLGRALSSLGQSPDDGLGDTDPKELAAEHGVTAKHSIEGICARESDCFTTVSEITAQEAELLHDRVADPVCPNGIDLDVIDELAGPVGREEARRRIARVASRFLGEDVSDAAFLCISGRYEFHNKGIDLLLDALMRVNESPGRPVVLFVLVPAGNSGVRGELRERLEDPEAPAEGPLGLSTHNLFDGDHDPVHEHCGRLGFSNVKGARVRVVQIPIYLSDQDGFLNLPYEAVLRAMDLSCFPSYYEPWGYTPQESLAVGVPTVTTDYAGFGRWAQGQGLGPEDGITVLPRVHVEYAAVTANLAEVIEGFLSSTQEREQVTAACRRTASLTAWSDLAENYFRAYDKALEAVRRRMARGVPQPRRPRRHVQVESAQKRPRLLRFDVSATLPEELRGLERLARNYWWSWDIEGMGIFEEVSPMAWEASRHNPVSFLQRVFPEDLADRAHDEAFLAKLQRVLDRFDRYLGEEGKARSFPEITPEHPVAYFSAEFAVQESLRIYSGGLGVLAGDHLKSASDLGLPLVAVGLFYGMGYMSQRLGPTGEQIAVDVANEPRSLAVRVVRNEAGEPLELTVPLPGRDLSFRAFRVRVGRVTLYLLDCDVPSNRAEDRLIARNLYGGENETRLLQEILLGRGGVRLLRQLGITPSVYHMNEGHAAFLTLERVGQLARKEGLTFDEARECVRATTLFTTHTPVPAGHDRFDEDVMRRYFSDVADWVGVPWERFYAMGRGDDGAFNMTYLALCFSSYCNGVSKLHGQATRRLLRTYWPAVLEEEVPVDSITNGVHLPTWTSPALAEVLGAADRSVSGEDFARPLDGPRLLAFWEHKQALKERLLEKVRVVLRRSFLERRDSPLLLNRMLDGLREDALYLVFARRFAPYKRAHLLFQDVERLRALLDDEDRPLRVFIAGKAHPRDDHGRSILQDIVSRSRSDELVGRVFFLENYDLDLARHLVQGADVWLNTPTRMLEASGTSGMKAAANGTLNVSIADGWWPEAADGENGWTIAGERVYEDQELQDQLDAAALYRILEEEVLPLYFERGADGVPRAWLERVQHCLETIPRTFDTDRMVGEYAAKAYVPLARNHARLASRPKADIRALAQERARVVKGFSSIAIRSAQVADLSEVRAGDAVDARVEVDLGPLTPEDVVVELVLGHAREDGELSDPTAVPLQHVEAVKDGLHVYEGSHVLHGSGRYAYGIRVRGQDESDPGEALRELVLWA